MRKIGIVLILLSIVSYGKMTFGAKLATKLAGKNVNTVLKKVSKSPYTKKLPPLKIKGVDPKVSKLVAVGNKISKRGKFEHDLIDKSNVPDDIIREYAKHGDTFLDTVKKFSKKVTTLSKTVFKKIKKQFTSMPDIKIKSTQSFNDKMITTLKYTGKKGWKATQELMALAKKYPKSTVVAGLMAWYVTDPESFFEQKDKLIAQIEATVKEGTSDISKIGLGVTSGIADGFIDVVKEKMTISNLLVLFLAFVAFVLWRLRSYISRYFHIKLENGLVNAKKNNKQKLNNNNDDEEGLL
jgi:hypothetical protein